MYRSCRTRISSREIVPPNKRILKPCGFYCLLTPLHTPSLFQVSPPELTLTFNMSLTSVIAATSMTPSHDVSIFRLSDDVLLHVLAQLSADDLVLLRKVRVTSSSTQLLY